MKPPALNKMHSEIALFQKAMLARNHELSLHHLGRAHILSQGSPLRHLSIHFIMLIYALRRYDVKEVVGQVLRLFVTLPGHLIGKVPQGNIGWSTVPLRAELPVPEDLKDLN